MKSTSGWLGQRRARLGAEAGDDIQRAVGEADIAREFGEADEAEAGVLGRLDDAGVAAGERGADRAAENLRGIVPRNDMAGDAMRIVDDRHRIAVEERQRVAMQFVGGRTIEFEIARRGDHIGGAVLQRLAGVAQFQRREFGGIVGDRLAELHQQAAALERGEPAPGALERLARRRDRPRDVLRAAARDSGEGAPVRWAKHIENASVRRADARPADDIGAEGQRGARCRATGYS